MAVTNYIWDGENCLAETDGSDVVQTVYTYEPETYGNLISSRVSGTTYYHHYDALGSTRQLSNAAGTVSDTWVYDAWGNTISRTGATAIFLQWIGQIGYYFDSELGMAWVRARPLSPVNARWTTVDPAYFVNGANRFRYVGNRPTMSVDPAGKWELTMDCPSDRCKCKAQKCKFEQNPKLDKKGTGQVRICWDRSPTPWVDKTPIGEPLKPKPALSPEEELNLCNADRDHVLGTASIEVWWEGDNANQSAPCRIEEHEQILPDGTRVPASDNSWCNGLVRLSEEVPEPTGCVIVEKKNGRRIASIRHKITLELKCSCGNKESKQVVPLTQEIGPEQ